MNTQPVVAFSNCARMKAPCPHQACSADRGSGWSVRQPKGIKGIWLEREKSLCTDDTILHVENPEICNKGPSN